MTIDTNDIINSILRVFHASIISGPGTYRTSLLYMDQVTTFMDAQLAASKRYESDKTLQNDDQQLYQE